MALVMTIDTAHELQTEFNRYDRSDNFTPEGVRVLFEYLEEISEGSGEDTKLEIIGLCCEYSEDTFENIAVNYRIERSGEIIEDEEEIKRIVLDYLNNNTVVCGVTGTTAVYAVF